MESWIVLLKKIWRDLFWDDHGLNLPAVYFAVACTAAMVLACRALAGDGRFDFLQYSFGMAVLFVGYGAAAGSRIRTNARFARLEARIKDLEAAQQRVA